MPGPDIAYDRVPVASSPVSSIDEWRHYWAVEWPVYDYSPLSTIRRDAMSWLKHKYSDMTKYLQEKEDIITETYIEDVDSVLSGMYTVEGKNTSGKEKEMLVLPRFLTKEQMRDFTDASDHSEIGFGTDFVHESAFGSLKMNLKGKQEHQGDLFEIITRSFLWRRLREEQRDSATACMVLMGLSLLSLIFGAAIIGLATEELNGGKETILVSGFLSGSVMVTCSIIGFVGALSVDELWIRWHMTSAFFTMTVLTTLVYLQFNHILENEEGCSPSTSDHTSAGGAVGGDCEAKRTEVSAFLIISAISILNSFFITYTASVLLDAINDSTKLTDSMLLFRYFHYRSLGIQTKLDTDYGLRKFGEDSQLQTFNDISPAYAAARGMHKEDTKLSGVETDENTTPIIGH
eukprot:TRINITY_DN1917_c2_g1_i1.p1 TRINITY_DN1917_c2_g1~~TRINITY_DN1917_c2_g1_i1.p1  ORF type:complete len:426 (+),score=46.11 TRINITY_DN1917_c2_g1_i1:69-1280(+)